MINSQELFEENRVLSLRCSEYEAVLQKHQVEFENLKNQLEQYKQAHDLMLHHLNELRRSQFGKKSERYVESNPLQPSLFENIYVKEVPVIPEDEEITVSTHSRRKKNEKDLSKYPREIRIISLPEDEKLCSCGCQKSLMRYESRELYHYEPPKHIVIEQRREVYICKGKECENQAQSTISIAPTPLHILPKCKATEELLSNIVVSKVHHRQPLYHLEKYMNAMAISRETMARWMIDLVPPLKPLYGLMKEPLISYDIASTDATTLQVLKEPNRSPETDSFIYCMRGGPPGKEVILYAYNCEKHKTFLDEWFKGFKGNIHMDASEVTELLLSDDDVYASYCNAHGRRKFESIAKQVKKQGLCHEALRFYKKLYKIERQAKAEKLSPEERYKLRQKESAPVMEEFKKWLDVNYPLLLEKSSIAKAFEYVMKHWKGMTRFLEDGRLEIDNNHTEREIKPIVLARNSFLFADTQAGAEALAMHFSLSRTALLHGLDPYRYYVKVLKRIPYCRTQEDFEALLPWNIGNLD